MAQQFRKTQMKFHLQMYCRLVLVINYDRSELPRPKKGQKKHEKPVCRNPHIYLLAIKNPPSSGMYNIATKHNLSSTKRPAPCSLSKLNKMQFLNHSEQKWPRLSDEFLLCK
ncbi:hypothetical protein LOAG_06348 [Loa loa]|uniref:Uncharacterized protein n=1 Tax=Loa loa TaxID=7209 RepID=A0A1S0TY03_LOALO|nr:hypothetical protein LOAG_06348 [Loa loa]EFO22140.1 hypothetical protein LOAG_06348 [Loa loa]